MESFFLENFLASLVYISLSVKCRAGTAREEREGEREERELQWVSGKLYCYKATKLVSE